jgi:hypothetical protein
MPATLRRMNRSLFLEELRAARSEWHAALGAVPEERMLEPGLPGGWTVRDAVAHAQPGALRQLTGYSSRYMTWRPTRPSVGWANAPGTVPMTRNPSRS